MAESAAAPVAPSAELLEFPKKDKRRMLHAVYRVGDLDRTIQFYTEGLGMKLLRKRDIPEEKYSNAFLGFGPKDSHFVVELTYNYGVTSYYIGTRFGHFAIATEDVSIGNLNHRPFQEVVLIQADSFNVVIVSRQFRTSTAQFVVANLESVKHQLL